MTNVNIKIYQSFFMGEQYAHLDPAFVPYNNLKNEEPLKREYPLLLDLYEKNKNYDGYWGMVSRLFKAKMNMTGEEFKTLIADTPGYDVYHAVAFPDIEYLHPNIFVHGERAGYHPGLCGYINRLMAKLGYAGFDIWTTKFRPETFVYCSYYVGNQNFWERWMTFLQMCMEITDSDPELSEYMYGYTTIHYGQPNFANFPFVVERLVNLFLHLTPQVSSCGFIKPGFIKPT